MRAAGPLAAAAAITAALYGLDDDRRIDHAAVVQHLPDLVAFLAYSEGGVYDAKRCSIVAGSAVSHAPES